MMRGQAGERRGDSNKSHTMVIPISYSTKSDFPVLEKNMTTFPSLSSLLSESQREKRLDSARYGNPKARRASRRLNDGGWASKAPSSALPLGRRRASLRGVRGRSGRRASPDWGNSIPDRVERRCLRRGRCARLEEGVSHARDGRSRADTSPAGAGD